MFIEPHHCKKGWIEVVAGCMFSGKTEELIRRLRRAQIANQKVEIFKPDIDIRYDENDIISHNASRITSTAVDDPRKIIQLSIDADVIGIDEAQFFNPGIVPVVQQLANNNKRVIIAGLDMDFNARPFGPMPALLSIAEYITKLHAICVHCGDIASFSYRKINDHSSQIMIGEKDTYEPRCRDCFYHFKAS